MLILDTKINWREDWDNWPALTMDVDKVPDPSEYRYRAYSAGGGMTLYLSDNTEFVQFCIHDPKNETGFGGREYTLRMEDGPDVTITGPWSCNPTDVCSIVGVSLASVDVTERDGEFPNMAHSGLYIHELHARDICDYHGAHLIDLEQGKNVSGFRDGYTCKNVPSLAPDRLVKYRKAYGTDDVYEKDYFNK